MNTRRDGGAIVARKQKPPNLRPRCRLSTAESSAMISIRQIAHALGGQVAGRDTVLAPGPGHSRRDRWLAVLLDPSAPDGFLVHSHAGDDWRDCRDYVRQRLGLPAWQPVGWHCRPSCVFPFTALPFVEPCEAPALGFAVPTTVLTAARSAGVMSASSIGGSARTRSSDAG